MFVRGQNIDHAPPWTEGWLRPWCQYTKLVGIGTNGTAANIAGANLRD